MSVFYENVINDPKNVCLTFFICRHQLGDNLAFFQIDSVISVDDLNFTLFFNKYDNGEKIGIKFK